MFVTLGSADMVWNYLFKVTAILSTGTTNRQLDYNYLARKKELIVITMEHLDLETIKLRSKRIRELYHELERTHHGSEWTIEEDAGCVVIIKISAYRIFLINAIVKMRMISALFFFLIKEVFSNQSFRSCLANYIIISTKSNELGH